MQLRYRGVSSEFNSPMTQTVETEITAKFRGQTYQVRRLLAESYVQPQMNLKYRGIAYPINPTFASSKAKKRLC